MEIGAISIDDVHDFPKLMRQSELGPVQYIGNVVYAGTPMERTAGQPEVVKLAHGTFRMSIAIPHSAKFFYR